MKQLWIAIGSVGAVWWSVTSACMAQGQTEHRTITVSGQAQVNVQPDEVVLTLGVETWDKDLHEAKRQNDKHIKAIIDQAKRIGVEDKHLQTDHLKIEPRYEEYRKRDKFIGYFVRKTVVITLRDTGQFESVLSASLEAGANYVHGIEFRADLILIAAFVIGR